MLYLLVLSDTLNMEQRIPGKEGTNRGLKGVRSLMQLANGADASTAAQSGKLKGVRSLMQLANDAMHLPPVRQAARKYCCAVRQAERSHRELSGSCPSNVNRLPVVFSSVNFNFSSSQLQPMEDKMQRLFQKLIILVVMLPFILTACGGSSGTSNQSSTSGGNSSRSNIKFYVITHGQATDPFWSVVKKGVDQAAHDMGVQAIYEGPPPGTFDVAAMAKLIDTAVAAHPDGIVVSIPDANALGPSIKAAVAAGIPVISINSGSDVAKSLGVLVHIGQT